MPKKNIFIVGSDEFNQKELKTIDRAHKYEFIPLLQKEEANPKNDKPDIEALLDKARERLDNFEGNIDGIICFFDFPATLLSFILIQEYQLHGPSLESGLKCEHKYWSRIEQQKVTPDHVPDFAAVNPFEVKNIEDIAVSPPFWLKPVKAYGSQIGFKIDSQHELDEALPVIRENIGFFGEPFNYILSKAGLPDSISKIDGHHCIAESLIGGHQCTLSGYVHGDTVEIYGIVDSINYEDTDSFFYYLLPSGLPDDVQENMIEVTKRIIRSIGFKDAPFNIEFFYEKEKNNFYVLEINPRMSQSHSDLYNKVTGHSNHQVAVHLAQGMHPDFDMNHRQAKFGAKMHYRVFEDGIITNYPGDNELQQVKEKYPDVYFFPMASEGDRLSELERQDSYSYKLFAIYLGADSKEQLMDKYDDILEILNLKIEKIDA